MFADKTCEGTDGCKPLVAGGDATVTRGLDIGEKKADRIGRDIHNEKAIQRPVMCLGNEWKQQAQCVAIAVLRIAGKVTFDHNMFQQETPDPWAEQSGVTHGYGSMA